jgi:crossover junction endonuclease MUS81
MIVIDYREKRLIQLLTEKNIEHIVQNLEIGDIHLYNSSIINNSSIPVLIIERKEIKDLAASILDGRWREQKLRLLEATKMGSQIIYLIEGWNSNNNIDQFTLKRIPLLTLHGALINTIVRDKLYIYKVENIEETVNIIIKFYDSIKKNKIIIKNKSNETEHFNTHSWTSTVKINKKDNYTTKNCYINQLKCIPKVSDKIANIIVENFPTMKDLINAFEKNGENLLIDLKSDTRKIGKTSSLIYNSLFS